MKLKTACEIADACGLETIGQAVMNAELHYDALVSIDTMHKEFEELYQEAKKLGPDWKNISIYTIIPTSEDSKKWAPKKFNIKIF